jgi:hypothetical protein
MKQRVKLHMNVPQDVVELLSSWATDNASNRTTELVRTVRERAMREIKRKQSEQREVVR